MKRTESLIGRISNVNISSSGNNSFGVGYIRAEADFKLEFDFDISDNQTIVAKEPFIYHEKILSLCNELIKSASNKLSF